MRKVALKPPRTIPDQIRFEWPIKMQAWVFTGRVVPERTPLVIKASKFRRSWPDLGVETEFSIFVHDSQIACDVDVVSGTADVLTLRNLTEATIREVVDAIGYARGVSFDVEITSAISKTTDERIVFGHEIPSLWQQRQQNPTIINQELFNAILTNPEAGMALADFREAMRSPIGTGFFCYRAVEAIMQGMKVVPTENENTISWPRLRNALNINKETLIYLKNHSDFPRHGKIYSITDSDRAKIFAISDEILRRFFAYLVAGKLPLPLNDFPELLP